MVRQPWWNDGAGSVLERALPYAPHEYLCLVHQSYSQTLVSSGANCQLAQQKLAECGLCSGFSSLWGLSPMEGQRG